MRSKQINMDSNQGISDEDFREILSSMSGWYDHHGYINMLKVLYRDLVTEPDKLYAATKVMELFELLCISGHLSSADLAVLYDTINVTQQFGLEPEIRKFTTLLNIRTVSISKFTHDRQMLIKVVVSLSDNGVKKISQLYNCSDMADRWELFVDLEQRSEFCEENMDEFMKNITTYLIRSLHKDPLGLTVTGDMDTATKEASSPRTSTADDQGEIMVPGDTDVATIETDPSTSTDVQEKLIVTGDTDVATSEAGPSTSSDNVCIVNNMVIQGNRGSVTGSQFIQCNIGTVNVISTTEATATQGNQNDAEHVASSSNQHQEQQRDVAIKDYLKTWQRKLYKSVNQMTPPTWNKKYEIDIAQVFTELDLMKSKREDEGEQSKPPSTEREANPTTLAEVLDIIKSTDSCKVLITGKGGMGKTTLLRYIAHNWATDGDSTFAGKLLFLINIRNIKAGKNVLHSIMQKINLEDFNLETDLPEDPRIIKKFIKKHDSEIVLLLDGLDELEPGAESPICLFNGLEFVKSTVILTSRPDNTTDFEKSCDVLVKVEGFSPSNIKQYIYKHFKLFRRPKLGESMIREFGLDSENGLCYGGNHREAFELCSSPFLLLRICTMWKDKQYFPKDVCELFKEMTCCILNQYINRSDKGKAISQFDKIPKNYESAILALGKCMYEGLQKNKLSIDKDVLRKGECIDDEETLDLALNVGFVYQDKPAGEDDFSEIYTPPHKLISESLAGLYLCKQSQQGSLKSDECEMIRSNKYLHMTRVFTIGFLGANAGKLLKHWLINRSSNYFSLATYFKYVKKEHEKPILQELDKHMPTEMKAYSEQMFESYRNVLDDDDNRAIVSKNVHLIQLMRHCCVKYNLFEKLLSMIKRASQSSKECVCGMLVHILSIAGLPLDDEYKTVFEYIANWEDNEIDILSATMENLQFKYTFTNFYFDHNLPPNFLIHFLKTASDLTSLSILCDRVTGVVLNHVFIELHESKVFLKLEYLDLSNNDLSYVNGVSLANLLKIAPKLKVLNMSKCNLFDTIVNTMVTECQSCQVVLELNRLDIGHNYFRGIDGESFANLLKIVPKLEYLDISFCYIARFVCDELLNMCDKIGVVLPVLRLQGNDLSYIDGVSLTKLARVIFVYSYKLKWSDYCLSAAHLQGLINACGVDSRFKWQTLDLSGINLASIDGITLACLFKICPELDYLNIGNCNLSGSSMRNVLDGCDRTGVVLKDNMLFLKCNDLSDIDGVSLAKLVTVICVHDYSDHDCCFKWSDYSLSAAHIQCLINACGVDGRLKWRTLDLSGINLASIDGITLACLLKISPELEYLNISNCNLSGSSMRNVLDECDRTGVVLKDCMLFLKGNDLSDIDGVSLAKLVRVICGHDRYSRALFECSNDYYFKWSDYCLSAAHLQGLLLNACGVDGRLKWRTLDFSGITLASIDGIILASLFKIFPELEYLKISNCNLSGSSMRNVFDEFDRTGVVLKDSMRFFLKDNDLSDIDGVSFAKLVRLIGDSLKWSDYCLSAAHLQDLINACGVDCRLKWRTLDLSGINLASIDGITLACLFKISPQLKHLDMSNCNLSISSVRHVLDGCDKTGVVLKDSMQLFLNGNDLSDIDGVSLAKLVRLIGHSFKWSDYCLSAAHLQALINACGVDCRLKWQRLNLSGINLASINGITLAGLFKISPLLNHLDMSNCNLSGSSVRNVLNKCDEIGAVLKDRMLFLKDNDLSNIDGVSLAKLVRLIGYSFKWRDYCLSADNLQDLINACGVDGRLTWDMLDLGEINLASINGITIACLFKISPQLYYLAMNNCNMSGSSMMNVLDECDRTGVVLKDSMLFLKGNDFSDIDGVSLAKLIRVICVLDRCTHYHEIFEYSDYWSFKWSDYCLSAAHLQCLINACDVDGRLKWEILDLSGINLASINGITLASLFKISPKLNHIDMSNCSLSGSSMRNVLNECDKTGVVLKDSMLFLKGNNLLDIDGVSFAKLVRVISMNARYSRRHELFEYFDNCSFKWSDCCLSAAHLQDLINACGVDCRLKWRALDLSGINLASIDGITLACLFKISPLLNYLDMSNCNLSTSSVRHVLDECDKTGVVLKDSMQLFLKGNDLSGIDGVSLAKLVRLIGHSFKWSDYCLSAAHLQGLINACGVDCRLKWQRLNLSGINLASINGITLAGLFKISPLLNHLDMSNCNLSGSSVRNVLDECDKTGVVLKDNMLFLKNNDLSDIDGVSFSKLVRLIGHSFKWSDYCLSADNLQDLINACGVDGRLTWGKLDLSGINLALINGITLARLFKISPQLNHLDICNLSDSSMRNVLNECDRMSVVLKDSMLRLKGNYLTDIDGVSLAKLALRELDLSNNYLAECSALLLTSLLCIFPNLQRLNMSKCHLQSNVLHDVVRICEESGIVLGMTILYLSDNDFSSLNGTTVAGLSRCIPNLIYLDMSRCNLSGTSMEDLSWVSSDRNVMVALTDINLSGNDFSVLNKIMITAFCRFVPNLQCLNMSKCNISGSIVQHLSETNIMTLTSISLGENDLSDLNWASIASHMSYGSKLKILNIHDCHLSSSMLQEIGNAFSNRNVVLELTNVDLSSNDLSNLDGASLVPLGRAVPKLKILNISNCNLKGKDVHALVKPFVDVDFRYSLYYLNLSNNNFSDIDVASLASLCKSFYFLHGLNLSSCQLNDDILNRADSWQGRSRYLRLKIRPSDDYNIPVDYRSIQRRTLHNFVIP